MVLIHLNGVLHFLVVSSHDVFQLVYTLQIQLNHANMSLSIQNAKLLLLKILNVHKNIWICYKKDWLVLLFFTTIPTLKFLASIKNKFINGISLCLKVIEYRLDIYNKEWKKFDQEIAAHLFIRVVQQVCQKELWYLMIVTPGQKKQWIIFINELNKKNKWE